MQHTDTHPTQAHSCCAAKNKPEQHSHSYNAHGHQPHNRWQVAAHATVHCLTGCVIGEVVGLMIGVTLGLHQYQSMALSTLLAYLSGFTLTIVPLMKKTGMRFQTALKAIWLGEIVSIGVMELVMNTIDYHMGGMRASSVATWQFWQALLVAVPAGFIAAYPVNAWLIGKELKRCH